MDHQRDISQVRARADRCIEFFGASPIAREVLAQARESFDLGMPSSTAHFEIDTAPTLENLGVGQTFIHWLARSVYNASPLVVEAHFLPFLVRGFPVPERRGSKGVRSSNYRPQFFVVRTTLPPMFEDWYPLAALKRTASRGKGRLIFDNGRWRDIVAEECARQYGMTHRLWTEEGFELGCEQEDTATRINEVTTSDIYFEVKH